MPKNPSILSLPIACAALLSFVPQTSEGAILSQWNFNSANLNASGVLSGFQAQPMTHGTFGGSVGTGFPNVPGVDGTVAFVLPIYHSASGYRLTTSAAGALSSSHIFQFKMGPSAGNAVNFSSFSFNAWANTGFPDTVTDQYHFFVQSSLTGSTILQTFSSNYRTANAPDGTALRSLNLSSIPELQNVTQEVTFTIGVYTTNQMNVGNLRLDSIQMDGTVSPIPEPSAAMLSLLGLGAMLRRRQRSA